MEVKHGWDKSVFPSELRNKKVIGVDIGATRLKAGIVDAQGNLANFTVTPTLAHEGPQSIMGRVLDLVKRLLDRVPGVVGIGVGSAGRIDCSQGIVKFATDNIPGWSGTRIGPLLSERFGLPVMVDNDANAAAIAEGWLGAAQGCSNYLCLTLGTGIGGAMVVDGCVVRGAHYSAAEFGHMVLYPGGERCTCGGEGCMEQYVSGPALVRRANRVGLSCNSAEEVMDACRENNDNAVRVLKDFVLDLAWSLISLQNIFDPEVTVLGGGIVDAKDVWWATLEETLVRISPVQLEIRPAALKNHAGVIGAAKLVWDYWATCSC